jgi:photosystem I subunit V
MAALTLAPAQVSGLTALPLKANKKASFSSQTKLAVSKARTTCVADAFPFIAGSTAAALVIGRFGVNAYHKNSLKRAGLPVQNGVPHADAGDSRAQEVALFTKTNDPDGFTLADVLGWGALGHAVGFALLAIANNGYYPQF